MRSQCMIVLAGLLLIGAVGCKEIAGAGGPSMPVQQVDVWRVDMEALPPDVALVTLALLERMRGRSGEDLAVDFPAQAGQVREQGFLYEDFALEDVKILEYLEVGENDPRIQLAVVLSFEDMLGRRTAAYAQLVYGAEGERLFVEEALVRQVYPDFPQVRAVFVPEDAFREDPALVFNTFSDLYLFALEHGVPADFQGASGQTARYVALCFLMDRIAPDAALTLYLDDKRTGTSSGTDEFSQCYDFQGWRVGVLGFEHTLGQGKTLYVKAVYESPEFGPNLVGSFSTK